MTTTSASVSTLPIGQRLSAGLVALGLGFGLLIGVGFAGADQIHNAAHDTRHAVGFPCH